MQREKKLYNIKSHLIFSIGRYEVNYDYSLRDQWPNDHEKYNSLEEAVAEGLFPWRTVCFGHGSQKI